MGAQIQYQPITGPVWREPVADRLAWLPQGSSWPQRALAPNRLGDFVQPPFAALYRAEGLQWVASDRYSGRPLPGSLTRHIVLDPIPPADPKLLNWMPVERYAGRNLQRTLIDVSVYPRPVVTAAFDPQALEWMPQGTAPRVAVERRIAGDFQQPAFDALYKPDRLQWQPLDRYIGRPRPYSLQSRWVIDPASLVPPPFDPRSLSWLASGSLYPYRALRAIRTGFFITDAKPVPPPSILEVVPYLIEDVLNAALMRIASIYCTPVVIGSTGSVTVQDPVAFTRVPRGTTITITLGGTIKGSGTRRVQAPYGVPDTAPPFPDPKINRH